MRKYKAFFIPVLLIVIVIVIGVLVVNNINNSNVNSNDNSNDPLGTIYVEAGDGILSNEGSYSYIGESARGLEAYLGDKGASVLYNVQIEKAQDYTLMIKLTDDGLYTPGTRNATIVVNGNRTLGYVHFPEDTKGWKWYEIGTVTLVQGENTFVFTKNEDTAGAFVMDEFKLVP